jgi:hypothetical protein
VRKGFIVFGVSCLLLFAVFVATPAKAASSSKAGPGTIVIVFKDGHRQTFNLSEIERVEFPAGATAATDAPALNGQALTPRGRFFGKWEVGDGNGNNFYITLNENGTAHRSLRSIDGKWVYVNGEAQITWNDGAMDAIRKVGAKFQKFAYESGKSFTDVPANVTDAHNTSPRPI